MNFKRHTKLTAGSSLVLALLVAVVVSLTLASYLYLVGNERSLAARSLAWNAAIPAAEAGVEEALTQLYYTDISHLATNGWMLGGDGRYHKNGTLPSGSGYNTSIQLSAAPVIWSTGYVAAPFTSSNAFVSRLVKVTTSKTSGSGYGILARGKISLSGSAFIDSFDSTDPNHSTGGLYDHAKATANAVVLTDSLAAGAISLSGAAHIYGLAETGPGGTVTPSTGADSVRNDANVQIDDVSAPMMNTFSIVLPSGKVGGTTYDYVASTGNYNLSSLNVGGGKKMVVNGNAVIYCTSTANNCVVVGGSGYIYITPGSSLTLYVAGPSTISGSGVVNGNQNAISCSILGLPTCTAMTYSGSSDFIGMVNAPSADFTFSGNASASGSFIVNTASISGFGGVHYDTSLGGSGPGYVVQSWNEMPTQ